MSGKGGIVRSLLGTAALFLAALAAAPALADDPPPPDQVPLYDRYAATQAYVEGGDAGLAAFDAERNRVLGADDQAVDVEDRPDGTRDVTIQLEVIEVQEEVYPGKRILFWVYAPLGSSMSSPARLPSPTIRVEEGDHVKIVLYNTHYFPHTVHLHGMSVPAEMDGVPDFTQAGVPPGSKFIYEFVAKNPGTYWYHCHVDPSVHAMMGLSGMLIVEAKRPGNHFARVVVGGGRIAPMAKATAEQVQGEYSLVYQDVDDRLNRIALAYSDAREVEMRMHRDYDSSQRKPNVFLLNGRSSPFTLLDTPILVKSGETTKLRILNAGGGIVMFHPHGHHPILTDVDGDPLPPAAQYSRDTFEIGPAQRIDLALRTGDDGRYAAGPGVWMVHDHTPSAEVNNGIDGGDMTAIVYDGFMGADGLPKTFASLAMMFDPALYHGKMPLFDPRTMGSTAAGYDSGWPQRPPAGGDFDYPKRRDDDDGLPNLAAIDVARHRPVASACKERPRSTLRIVVKGGVAYALPGETFAFAPRQLHVERCQAVTIVFENTDAVRHDLMIPGLDPMLAINVLGPATQEASFVTPDEDVTLVYHCHVSTHERHGMMGLLIVGKGSALAPSQAEGLVPEVLLAAETTPADGAKPMGGMTMGGMGDATAPPPAPATVFHGTGVVVATVPRTRQLVIAGDDIPGYMAAMTMGYAVAAPALLEGLSPQDRIGFTIDAKTNTITAVQVLQHGP